MGTGEATLLSIDCPNGTEISLSAVATNTGNPMFDAGIIPSTSDVNTYCMNSAFTDPDSCSSKLNTQAMKNDLTTKCVDKSLQSC
jgi:hypothetical protein